MRNGTKKYTLKEEIMGRGKRPTKSISIKGVVINFFNQILSHTKAKDKYIESILQLEWPGVIVEIDELKFGKRKYHRGHRVKCVWLVGLVEKILSRKICYVPLQKRDQITLHAIISKIVLPSSIIRTDGWQGYNNLSDIY